MTLVRAPSEMPSLETVILPSRAFLRSFSQQTVPAREAAIDAAIRLYDDVADSEDVGLRDMALLGVVSDTMQPLEDLAYLAAAWDAPFSGLATYVRATTYSDRIPTNFWQGVGRWDDDRLDVLAGVAVRDPNSKLITGVLDLTGFTAALSGDDLAVLEKARVASRSRLRSSLTSLAADWEQFALYFHAFKHGGLALNRVDCEFVDDHVTALTDEVERFEPSIAVWRRRVADSEVVADHSFQPGQVVEQASASGRLAIGIVDRMLASRLAMLGCLEIDDDGNVAGLKPELQLPWSIWLNESDLTTEEWAKLGAGPRLRWVPEPA